MAEQKLKLIGVIGVLDVVLGVLGEEARIGQGRIVDTLKYYSTSSLVGESMSPDRFGRRLQVAGCRLQLYGEGTWPICHTLPSLPLFYTRSCLLLSVPPHLYCSILRGRRGDVQRQQQPQSRLHQAGQSIRNPGVSDVRCGEPDASVPP